ncbi:MAG: hypothetical protein EBT02_04860 [Planctomycetia bacterium]|nr:hypothetical protein [Planctomycetia bacterium]
MWTSLFVSGLLATAQTPLEKLAIPVAPVSVVQAPAAPKSAAPMAPKAVPVANSLINQGSPSKVMQI